MAEKDENNLYVYIYSDLDDDFVFAETKYTLEYLHKLQKENEMLKEENEAIKKQLNYLRSGEYYNQLKFERNMLQDIVDNGVVSQEDKMYIDCTRRNTELLEENNQLKSKLQQKEDIINKAKDTLQRGITFCKNDSQGAYDICNMAIKREENVLEILNSGGE